MLVAVFSANDCGSFSSFRFLRNRLSSARSSGLMLICSESFAGLCCCLHFLLRFCRGGFCGLTFFCVALFVWLVVLLYWCRGGGLILSRCMFWRSCDRIVRASPACFEFGRGSCIVPPSSTSSINWRSGTVSWGSRCEFCMRVCFDLVKPSDAMFRSSRLVRIVGQAAIPS